MSEIVASWTVAGVPLVAPTDTPEVTIRRIDTQAIVAGPSAMTEIGEGSFAFTFAPAATLEYAIVADGDPLGNGQVGVLDRYQYGALSGIVEARIETDIPAILVDTGTTLPAQITALEAAVIMADLVVAAGSSTTEVRTDATQADDFYNEAIIVVINTAGVAARRVADYANTNGAFTLADALPFTPASLDRAVVLPADNFQTTTIRKIETNRWLMDEGTNEMTFFDDDGTTPLVVFDLTDDAGAPSTDSVFERVPQ